MKIESFQSGKLRQQYQYKSFYPAPINQEWSWEGARISTLLERTSKALGDTHSSGSIHPCQ
ncbi:MAG: hypothetical protein HQL99_11335 [Magnetococcales bacterium]|nr:hypothetical protein [Magnetococcales bacterium]